jgi:phosphonate transport system substrate-binding protein
VKLSRLSRVAGAAVAATLAVTLAGCAGATTPAATASETYGFEGVFTIGYLPQDETPHFAAARVGLSEELAEEFGFEVEEVHVSDMTGMVEALRLGHIDMAIVGAMGAVHAYDRAGALPIVTLMQPEGPLHSDIVVRADSGIYTIEDLEGRSMAFVDTISTTGTLLPSIGVMETFPERDFTFESLQVNGEFFSSVMFAGSHPGVVTAVIMGDADAGGIAHRQAAVELEREGLPEDYLRVIHRSEPVMGATMVINSGLDDDFIAEIQDFLLDFDNEDYFYGMWGNRGGRFVETSMEDFGDLQVIDAMLD